MAEKKSKCPNGFLSPRPLCSESKPLKDPSKKCKDLKKKRILKRWEDCFKEKLGLEDRMKVKLKLKNSGVSAQGPKKPLIIFGIYMRKN